MFDDGAVPVQLESEGSMSQPAPKGYWKNVLVDRLHTFGHRNWIVIADAAYPLQTAEGIETKDTGDHHEHVLEEVLSAIGRVKHIRPIVYIDAELPYLTEQHAPGIDALRAQLDTILQGQNVRSRPHEEIIAQLDEAGRTFHVLLLKTQLTLPYTSVFLQLECGYWNEEAEQELRRAMESS